MNYCILVALDKGLGNHSCRIGLYEMEVSDLFVRYGVLTLDNCGFAFLTVAVPKGLTTLVPMPAADVACCRD